MAEVTSLDDARAARARRAQAAADAAPSHPALRWVAGTTWWVAHRRDRKAGSAACGAAGDLILAPPGVPLCEDCYPAAARRSS